MSQSTEIKVAGTIICASHDPAIVEEIATHVYSVEHGEVSLNEVKV